MNALTIIKRGDPTPPDALVLYCGRGSALGNPHVMRNASDKERNRVCDLYAAEFPNARQRAECEWIAKRLEAVPVALECFCVPKRCHCETVRDFILTLIEV